MPKTNWTGKSSRRKGHDFEREIARQLREVFGDGVHRGFQSRSGGEAPDVEVPYFWIECKRGQRTNIKAALEQAMSAMGPGKIALAVCKDDKQPATATLLLDDLLDLLESDRVAVVTFAGAAAHFPLSHDYEAVRNLYVGLSPQDMPPGSDLGEALLVARCLVRPDLVEDPGCARVGGRGGGGAPVGQDGAAPAPEPEPRTDRSRVIVLFTDGEDTGDRARAEVEQAVMLGIHVYLVGIGTVAGELIPELDDDGEQVGWKKTADGQSFVTTRLDQAGLQELAAVAGGDGHYFEGVAAKDLAGLLGHLEKGDLDARMETEWKSVYQWLLFPAFLLLAIEACTSGRRRRVLYPEEQS